MGRAEEQAYRDAKKAAVEALNWSGRADKAAMIAEAKRRGFKPTDDNAADALAILHWATAQETE